MSHGLSSCERERVELQFMCLQPLGDCMVLVHDKKSNAKRALACCLRAALLFSGTAARSRQERLTASGASHKDRSEFTDGGAARRFLSYSVCRGGPCARRRAGRIKPKRWQSFAVWPYLVPTCYSGLRLHIHSLVRRLPFEEIYMLEVGRQEAPIGLRQARLAGA